MKILGHKLADIGFFINLESSVDRLENANKQIEDFEISDLHRIPALTDSMIQSSATKSHREVFSKCRELNIDSVVVLEDDFQIYDKVYVGDNKEKQLSEYLEELMVDLESQDWDVLMLGFNGRKVAIPITKHLSIPFRSTGGWGYIIKKSAYEYILDNFDYYRDRMAIDDILPYLNFVGFRTLATNVQIVHHGIGFISTLNPQGPVNYKQWIDGNYYNSIWRHAETFDNFDNILQQVFDNSEFNRENILLFKNYPKDIVQVENFINSNKKIKGSLILLSRDHVTEDEYRAFNYHFVVESSSLVIWDFQLEPIKPFYKKIIELDLNQNYEQFN